MPSVGRRMLNNAVSLRFWDIPVASLSNNATDQEIIDILKTCQSFLVLLQKLLCQYYFPTKRKLLETHAIPKNCPIYFSMIKKMPLNILQQKLQIYTQTGSSRGQWSHWFVVFFFVVVIFLSVPPPPSILMCRLKTNYSTGLFISHNPDVVWGLKVVNLLQPDLNVNSRLWK